ncbi:POM121-like protein 12 [Perognathus longimembris pacificus]|uniref:POM121-like protein 12 n=1 Tax=Perognathus longimembris pacificus TaxID=214514 RepID=UPI0020198E56|nr:POM121-like protein 12 [Perognathus longimembris pacificus]
MGNSLGSPQPDPTPPTPSRPRPRPAWVEEPVRHVQEDGRVSTGPVPKALLHWPLGTGTPLRMVSATRRHSPAKVSPGVAIGPDLSRAWKTYMKRWLWSSRNPVRTCSPVIIKIAPPGRRSSPLVVPRQRAHSARCPVAAGEPLDPSSREAVLKALSQCKKGNRKFDGPLWFEIPETMSKKHSSMSTPSAFKPCIKNGMVSSFLPRPGPLNQRPFSWRLNVCEEEHNPVPYVHPHALIASEQEAESPLERRENMKTVCGLGHIPEQQNRVCRVSFAPEDSQPAGPFAF